MSSTNPGPPRSIAESEARKRVPYDRNKEGNLSGEQLESRKPMPYQRSEVLPAFSRTVSHGNGGTSN